MVKIVRGQNDLLSQKPELAKEWHPTKNGVLMPEHVGMQSRKRVWWQCEKGHEWEARIDGRFHGNGCPYCSGHRVLPGINDLLSKDPELAKEWHPYKNGDLGPEDVTTGSNKRVWWQCEKGHEWQARVTDRVKGNRCGICAWKDLPKYRVLLSTMPELAKEWHPLKNGTLTPSKILANSRKRVWWQCEKGHEWQTDPMSRVRRRGCPYCALKRARPGVNDLATVMPELVKEWHPIKNGVLQPTEVTPGSGKKAWWQCEKGHEWQAQIVSRVRGSQCPICAGRKVLPGYNDLLSHDPELAAEWHPTKNDELTPEQVTVHSNKKVWWQCEKGHAWCTTVASRSNGHGCPVCAGKRKDTAPDEGDSDE